MQGSGIRRRLLLSTVAAGVATGPALVVHAQQRPSAVRRKIVVALANRAALAYLPLTIADHLGFCAKEGFSLELQDHGSGPRAVQAVQAAQADVVSDSYCQTIAMQGQGAYFRAFVLLARAPQVALAISTRALPGYKGLPDLKDRVVAITGEGASSHALVALTLRRAGLTDAHVHLLPLPDGNEAVAAVRAGTVHAICYGEPVMTLLEQRSEVRVIADTRTLRGAQEVFGGPLPASCLFAPENFIVAQAPTAQALANAATRALKWLQTAGPSDLIKVVPEPYLMGDRGLYLAAFNKVRETIALNGLIPEDGTRVAQRVQARVFAAVQPPRVVLARTYTNTFSQKAKEKYLA